MKKIILTLTAIAALLAPPTEAAILVGPSPTGTGTLTFDTQPAVGDWSSRDPGGASADYATAAALDAAIQTNVASAINVVLGTSGTTPLSEAALARRHTSSFWLQTPPTGNAYSMLLATLQNDTGAAATGFTVEYDFGEEHAAGTTVTEEIAGHRVFYSLSGEAHSWQLIPELSSAAIGRLSATVSAGAWSAGSPLYLLFVDDNAAANRDDAGTEEGGYTIDNFVLVANQGVVEPRIDILTPTNNTVVPQSVTINVTTLVQGAVNSVDFFVDDSLVSSDATSPFSLALDTTFYSVGNHLLRARANVEGGAIIDTTNRTFTLLANQPPVVIITNVYSGTITGTTFLVGSPVVFQTRVGDDVAVTNMEWYIDGQPYILNRVAGNPNYPNMTYVDSLAGTHEIYGVAVDNSGQTTLSSVITLTITNPPPNVNLLIANGSEWLYYGTNISITPEGSTVFPPPAASGSTWTELFYSAAGWTPLLMEIGGGDTVDGYPEKSTVDIGPTGGRYLAHYLRKSFFVPGDAAYENLQIRLLRDDGAIVFINGIPVWTNNMAAASLDEGYQNPPPWVFAYTNLALASDDGLNFQVLNIIGAANIFSDGVGGGGPLVRGDNNIIAVEVHQQSATSSDFSFDLMLWGESAPALPPVITITTPTNNQNYYVGDNVAVTATASTVFVTNVIFQLDGVPQVNDDIPPSPFTGTIPSVPLGQHQITAVGQDALGNVVISDPVTIIVNADQPPAVAISAVYNAGVTGSVFLVGSAVTNAVTATDDLGVTNVAFYLNGMFRSQDTTSPYGPFIVGDALAGTNVFTAVAYDNKGQTNFATVLVTITNPPYALILTNGSDWKFDDTGVAPPADWIQLAFNDSGWSNGVAELGFGDIDAFNPEQTVIRRTSELGVATTNFYYRKTFTVANPAAYTNLIVSLLRDDGGQVYLNGALVFTSPANFPSTTATPDDGSIYYRTNVAPASLVSGPNIVAVHVAQNNTTSSDTSFDLMLWGQTATASAPQIHVANSGTQIVITWTGSAVLQQAGAVTGSFEDVPGNPASPFTINLPAPGNAQFYRLRQ